MGFQVNLYLAWNPTELKEEWAESITLDAESLHLTEEEGNKPIICQIYKQSCIPDYRST